MTFRRALLSTMVAASTFVSIAAAEAAEPLKFDGAAFREAQTAGRSIVVEVHAPWCPTCKAQKGIIFELSTKTEYMDVVFFTLDFDSQKADQKQLAVRTQSTLIAFKGDKETGRSVGDTSETGIEGLVKSAL